MKPDTTENLLDDQESFQMKSSSPKLNALMMLMSSLLSNGFGENTKNLEPLVQMIVQNFKQEDLKINENKIKNLQTQLSLQNNLNGDLIMQLQQKQSQCATLMEEKLQLNKIHQSKMQALTKKLNEIEAENIRLKKSIDLPHKKNSTDFFAASLTAPSSPLPSPSPAVVTSTPPPPPPPFFSLSSPPAPPLVLNIFNQPNINSAKNIPASKVRMKFFNWNKISNNNFEGTLWVKCNEEKYYEILDLNEFENTFSAYQNSSKNSTHTNNNTSGDLNDSGFSLNNVNSLQSMNNEIADVASDDLALKNGNKLKKEFSMIDNRRATNLEILLAKFKKIKLTNKSLQDLILNLDPRDELPKDIIEQLLKFVPTAEEEALLKENSGEFMNMAEPDRFLFDMSRIFHYKQKLEALYYKKKYTERFRELKTKFTQTIDCCTSLLENQNVLTMLKIVLCMGNYMNQRHSNGTVTGFSISNLNKLIDIKSSTDKTYSLLHYLINTLEKKCPDVLKIFNELDLVQQVSKINLETLQIEWRSMEKGFNQLHKEVNDHKSNLSGLKENDQFIDVIIKFHKEHNKSMLELEQMFFKMKTEYAKTLRYFGEDQKNISFEEFFNTWNTFLNSFNETRIELKTRKEREISEVNRKQQKEAEVLNKQAIRLRLKNNQLNDFQEANQQRVRFRKSTAPCDQGHSMNDKELDSLMVNAISNENISLFGSTSYAKRPKALSSRRRCIDFPYKVYNSRERVHSTIQF